MDDRRAEVCPVRGAVGWTVVVADRFGLGLFADGRFGVGMSLWTTGVPKYVQ